MQADGIGLLDVDSTDDLALVDELTINPGRIPPAVKKAIIIEKANGAPSRLIAVRYDVSESSVSEIWRKFCTESAKVGTLAAESVEDTRKWLRGKALSAIDNGLSDDRDAYRQAALGVQVMKGIGEFKTEHGEGAKVNIMINNVPDGWKDRYIGNGGGEK